MKVLVLLATLLLSAVIVNADAHSSITFFEAVEASYTIGEELRAYEIHGVFVTTLAAENSSHTIEFDEYVLPTDFSVHVMMNLDVQTPLTSYSEILIFFEDTVPVQLLPEDSSSASEEDDFTICPALAVQCSDGSWAGLSGPKCLPNCPTEKPVGGLPFTEVVRVAQSYLTMYGYQDPIGIQVSQLKQEDMTKQMALTANETLEDYCIDVFFFNSSHSIPTPSVYEGVRMFYKERPSTERCLHIKHRQHVCPDGMAPLIGPNCTRMCSPMIARSSSSRGVLGTVLIIVSISLLSCVLCCCRACRKRCKKNCRGFQPVPTQVPVPVEVDEAYYYAPNEQQDGFEMSEQQMPPMMMMPPHPYAMMMPPMMPPPMMMPPPTMDANGNVMPPHPFFHPMFGPMMAAPAGYMMVPPQHEQQQEQPSNQ